MTDIKLELATDDDAEALMTVQRKEFDLQADRAGIDHHRGPDGYDQVGCTGLMIRQGQMHKVVLDGTIVGGAIVTMKGARVVRINRIFIDPVWQNRGFGRAVIERTIIAHPEVHLCSLDTPDWSAQNQHFYDSLGFRQVKKTKEPISGFDMIDYVLEVE